MGACCAQKALSGEEFYTLNAPSLEVAKPYR